MVKRKSHLRRIEKLRDHLIRDVEEQLAEEAEYGTVSSTERKLGYTLAKIQGARPRGLFLIAKQMVYDLETVLDILQMYETAEIVITYPKEPWMTSDFRGWST